jgi:transposase InsO family protein
MMCKVFKVTKSSYYRWLKEGPSNRWKENERLLVEIMDVFEESDSSYGSPRVTKKLKVKGWVVGKKRVASMMRAADLRARKLKRFKVTTDSKYNDPVAPNLLDQKFHATRPGEI